MSAEVGRQAGRGRAALVFVAAAGLVLYAPLLSWLDEGLGAAFRYFAADAFYYLNVAARSAEAGFFSFDGTHPVNGFQPLFQSLLYGLFRGLAWDADSQILLSFFTCALLAALGTGFFALAVLSLTRSPSLALLAAVPGFYAWLVPTAHPELDGRWAFANGMESACSMLLFGIALWLLIARDWLRPPSPAPRILLFSLLLTLIAFSRLDEALLLMPFGLWLVLGESSWPGRLRQAALFGVVPAVCFAAYLLWNRSYAGSALPLSGVAKLDGLAFLRNGYAMLTTLAPFADVRGADLRVWGAETWRVERMLVPALAATAWLALRRPRAWWDPGRDAHLRVLVSLLAVYVLLRAAFNFAFVPLWQQGPWYYPLSMLSFDLLVAVGLADALRSIDWPALRSRWVPVGWFALLALAATSHASLLVGSDRHGTSQAFWEQRDLLRDELQERCPGCGLVSFDDGLLAYALGLPTLNGLGLVLDAEAYAAKREGRLLPLAHARGHRILATLHYPFATEPGDADLDRALADYAFLEGEDLAAWRFELLFRDPLSGAVFVRFERR